jgi:FtsZ-binding cell division protein ZapB
MTYTLGQAAKAVGMTKGAIAFAIKKGRISARKDDFGQWAIDPAELHRVYEPCTSAKKAELHDAAPIAQVVAPREIIKENEELKAALKVVKEERDRLSAEVVEVKSDRNAWREQAQSIKLLAAPKPPEDDRYAALLERLEAIEHDTATTTETTQPAEEKRGWVSRLKAKFA